MTVRGQGKFYEYRLFGLPFRSQIELLELDPCAHGDPVAIEIEVGTVEAVAGAAASHWLAASADGATLTVTDVARFAIRAGRSIVVDAYPAASPRNVRLFLLGSAMGVLLHQRGILPLHANAVEIDGRAIAFLGRSGAGKSTLAAAFHDRGSRILSDDVCAVTLLNGDFIAEPGVPRLRLWRDAIERSGRDTAAYERAFETLDKYTVPTDHAARAEPLRLGAVFLLGQHESEAPAEISRLSGVAAIEALMENTYRGGFIAIAGDPRAHFEACLQLARSVPVFRLSRPWDSSRIGETIAQVQTELDMITRQTSVNQRQA